MLNATTKSPVLFFVAAMSRIAERWRITREEQQVLDTVTTLSWHDSRVWGGEMFQTEHNRIMWSIQDEYSMAIDRLEFIGTIAQALYIGRSGHPVIRMWGNTCELGYKKSLGFVPHCENFTWMVVLLCQRAEDICVNESFAIHWGSSIINLAEC